MSLSLCEACCARADRLGGCAIDCTMRWCACLHRADPTFTEHILRSTEQISQALRAGYYLGRRV